MTRRPISKPLLACAGAASLIRWWVITVGHPVCHSAQLGSPNARDTCLRLVGDMEYFRVQGHYLAKGHGYLNNTALVLGRVRPGAYHPPLFPTVLIPAGFGIASLRRRRLPVSPLLGLFALVTVSTALTSAVVRYRASADVALVLLAGIGAADIYLRHVQSRLQAWRAARPSGSTARSTVATLLTQTSHATLAVAFVVPAAVGGISAPARPPTATVATADRATSCDRSYNLVLLLDAYDATSAAEPAARLRLGAPPAIVARIDQVVATQGDVVALPPRRVGGRDQGTVGPHRRSLQPVRRRLRHPAEDAGSPDVSATEHPGEDRAHHDSRMTRTTPPQRALRSRPRCPRRYP